MYGFNDTKIVVNCTSSNNTKEIQQDAMHFNTSIRYWYISKSIGFFALANSSQVEKYPFSIYWGGVHTILHSYSTMPFWKKGVHVLVGAIPVLETKKFGTIARLTKNGIWQLSRIVSFCHAPPNHLPTWRVDGSGKILKVHPALCVGCTVKDPTLSEFWQLLLWISNLVSHIMI